MHDIERLYIEVYRAKVKTMIYITHGDLPAAEDIVQEAFTRAWQYYPSFDEERGPIIAWFNGILFNALRDYQRQEHGEPTPIHKDVSLEDIISYPTKSRKEITKEVSCVANAKHKRVLELFYILGYNSREIGEIEHGVTQSNVTTIVNRFKDQLRLKR